MSCTIYLVDADPCNARIWSPLGLRSTPYRALELHLAKCHHITSRLDPNNQEVVYLTVSFVSQCIEKITLYVFCLLIWGWRVNVTGHGGWNLRKRFEHPCQEVRVDGRDFMPINLRVWIYIVWILRRSKRNKTHSSVTESVSTKPKNQLENSRNDCQSQDIYGRELSTW